MISKENVRISIILQKENLDKLKILAEKEKRSISNLCAKILSDYLDSLSKVEKN